MLAHLLTGHAKRCVIKGTGQLNQPIKDFLNEDPPRRNSLVDEIVLKARKNYLLFFGGTVIISLISFCMVYYLEYPAIQHALYLLLFCIIFFVLPAYFIHRVTIGRTKTVASLGQLLEGVVVTSKKFRGWNRVGIEVKSPNLKSALINFTLIPMKPIIVVGGKIPILYHSDCQRIAIAYFRKCGFEIGHVVRNNYTNWFVGIGVVFAFSGILLWLFF